MTVDSYPKDRKLSANEDQYIDDALADFEVGARMSRLGDKNDRKYLYIHSLLLRDQIF